MTDSHNDLQAALSRRSALAQGMFNLGVMLLVLVSIGTPLIYLEIALAAGYVCYSRQDVHAQVRVLVMLVFLAALMVQSYYWQSLPHTHWLNAVPAWVLGV